MNKYSVFSLAILFFLGFLTACDDETIVINETPSAYNYDGFDFQSRYLTLASGKKIHYIEEGEGEPLILMHGGPTSAFAWRSMIPELAKHARVIAYDQINYGGSDKDLEHYSYDWKAENLRMFMDKMGIEKAKFVVTDIGGPTTFTFGVHHPERIEGIAIFETALMPFPSRSIMPGFFQEVYSPGGEELIAQDNFLVETLMFKNQFNGKPSPTFQPMLIRDFTAEEAEVYRRPFATEKSRKHFVDIVFNGLGFMDEPGEALDIWMRFQQYLITTDVPRLVLFGNPSFVQQGDLPAIDPNGNPLTDPITGKMVTFRNMVSGQISPAFGAWLHPETVKVYDMQTPTNHYWSEEVNGAPEELTEEILKWMEESF